MSLQRCIKHIILIFDETIISLTIETKQEPSDGIAMSGPAIIYIIQKIMPRQLTSIQTLSVIELHVKSNFYSSCHQVLFFI